MRYVVAGLVVLGCIAAPRVSAAGDLHSFFDGACRRYTGVVVQVDDESIKVVNLSGRLVQISRASLQAMVVHQPLENPLETLTVDANLRRYLRDVWVGDDEQPSFTGWATSFFDDLLIFVDLDGKTHVVNPGDISKLSDSTTALGVLRPRQFASARLSFPPELIPCSKVAPAKGSLPPSRVIADRIKLGDYFGKLEQHYLALEGFEERTRLYAQPFVFDQASRVGLIYYQGMDFPLPFYFRWSGGRPYRFQSETVVGNAVHKWLPFATPSLSVASDAKSHFFNATFVGNVVALPAGTNAFILDDLNEEEEPGAARPKLGVETSYNYLIMMGADYWRLSASAGPAYLSTKIGAGVQSINIRADELSPTVRLRYQGPDLSLRALYFRTRMAGPLDEDLGFDEDATYSMRSDIIRAGATFRLWRGIEISVDQIVHVGRFGLRWPGNNANLKYVYFDSNASVAADFGRYVTVRGYARVLVRRHDLTGLEDEDNIVLSNDNRVEPTFGGALEFVF